MRIIGIDPGTKSFDFFGMEDDKVFIDLSIPSIEVAQNPEVILKTLKEFQPLDLIVGPSGYGLPMVYLKDATDKDLELMLPRESRGVGISVNEGIVRLFHLMKKEGLPVLFTPGVIHLPTVPYFRKVNKMDMGTADKVCVVALAMKDQAEYYGIDYKETSFIVVEMGFGFNAVIGVEEGKIVDGLGGTSCFPGFLTPGALNGELAIRFGKQPQSVLFTGGIKDLTGKEDLTPDELINYPEAWQAFKESVTKGVAVMMVSIENPREILISGRLSRIPQIMEGVKSSLSRFGKVRRIRHRAKIAKEAAEGAYIIGEGFLGGRYKGIVDSLKLREAKGTMYDYIKIKVLDFAYPQ